MYGGLIQRRTDQIDELLRVRPEVTPANRERSSFKFGLNIQKGGKTTLIVIRIVLPPNFPDAPPSADVLTPNVKHNWIDASGNIVGCSSMYSWNQYSRLSQVAGDIMNQFVQSPPQVVDFGMNNNNNNNGSCQDRNSNKRNSLYKRANSLEEDGVFLPPIPDSFDELDDLTLEELQKNPE